MIASARNAHPNNHTIDADDTENQTYSFTFIGDNAACVVFHVYDLQTMERILHRPFQLKPGFSPSFENNHGWGISGNQYADIRPVNNINPVHSLMIVRSKEDGDFYNGDVIVQKMNDTFNFSTEENPDGIPISNSFNVRTIWNNREYSWRAIIVERVSADEHGYIDLSGKRPSVKVSGGSVHENPYILGTVGTIMNDKEILKQLRALNQPTDGVNLNIVISAPPGGNLFVRTPEILTQPYLHLPVLHGIKGALGSVWGVDAYNRNTSLVLKTRTFGIKLPEHPFDIGDVNGDEVITIDDKLEILKFLVRMYGAIIRGKLRAGSSPFVWEDENGEVITTDDNLVFADLLHEGAVGRYIVDKRAFEAAAILAPTPFTISNFTPSYVPTIFDALEISKFIIRMSSSLDLKYEDILPSPGDEIVAMPAPYSDSLGRNNWCLDHPYNPNSLWYAVPGEEIILQADKDLNIDSRFINTVLTSKQLKNNSGRIKGDVVRVLSSEVDKNGNTVSEVDGTGDGIVTIDDALEILKSIVNTSEVIEFGNDSWWAACITDVDEFGEPNTPSRKWQLLHQIEI